MATLYKVVSDHYGDPETSTFEFLKSVLQMFKKEDCDLEGRYLEISADETQIIERDHNDESHREIVAEEYKIEVAHLETDDLHPLWQQYEGQLNTQPAYIEFNSITDELSADYSGEIGGGVPEDVYYGKRRRYSISPHLTLDEINTLLDEVAAVLETDSGKDVERMCADRLTESHGVLAVEDWMQGIDPCDEYGLTADSTDDDLETIAAAMVDYATGEGCTITGAVGFCEYLRDELRRKEDEMDIDLSASRVEIAREVINDPKFGPAPDIAREIERRVAERQCEASPWTYRYEELNSVHGGWIIRETVQYLDEMPESTWNRYLPMRRWSMGEEG